MNIRAYLLIVFLACLGVAKPISEGEAKFASGATGAVAGFLAGGISYNVLTDGMSMRSSTADGFVTGSVAVGVGAFFSWLAYKFFKRFTPRGRYLRARSILDELYGRGLIFDGVDLSDYDFIQRVNSIVGGTWPLAVAVERYDSYRLKLGVAFSLIRAARDAAPFGSALYNDCNELENKARFIFYIIESKERVLRNSNDYKFQSQAYQKYKIEMAKMEQEKREREKDRWRKQVMHWDKMDQKNKDRKMKKDFLDRQAGNRNMKVTVSI